MDSVAVSAITLAVWLLSSIIWGESRHSVIELFSWISYLLLFSASRSVGIEFVMWLLLPNGLILSVMQLYEQRKNQDAYHTFKLFGNSNHQSAFLLTSFYSAMWLSLNISLWFLVCAVIIGLAISKTKCRGATAALIVSVIALACMLESEMVIYSSIVFVIFGVLNLRSFMNRNYSDRLVIYRDAIKKIHPRWITGRGLNFFRLTEYGRVHNDYIEIIGETGLIGLLLIVMLFAQITFTPVILSCLIAFAIHSLVFYPLREVHTAAPFWAIMGASAAPVYNAVPMYVLRSISIIAVSFILIFVFTVFSNLVKIKR